MPVLPSHLVKDVGVFMCVLMSDPMDPVAVCLKRKLTENFPASASLAAWIFLPGIIFLGHTPRKINIEPC